MFRALVPYFGQVLPAAFFQRTTKFVPSVVRVHHLVEGIYKPDGTRYPLAIASMLKSQYKDVVSYNPDRTWSMLYSPKDGPMTWAVNAGLLLCRDEQQPVLVLRQKSDKTGRDGARHHLLGLGYVESFDPGNDLFRIRGLDWAEVSAFLGLGLSDDLVETALRLEALEAWAPFVAEDRAVYQVSRQKRDVAFSGIVLDNYGYTCAVTGQRFHTQNHVEAEGAHIISKDKRGTDDPRNGIALSKSVHWAFDRGIFTISDQYEIVLNSKVRSASTANFPLLALHGQRIQLPKDSYFHPHPEALAWHKAEIFDRFQL